MRSAEAEKRLNAVNRRVGELLDAVANGMEPKGLDEATLTRINIRLPTRDSPESLIVVKAVSEQGRHIAFVGGLDVVQAMLTWRAKEAGPGLKWREDVPWSER